MTPVQPAQPVTLTHADRDPSTGWLTAWQRRDGHWRGYVLHRWEPGLQHLGWFPADRITALAPLPGEAAQDLP